MRQMTELAKFIAVRDAWGGTIYLRPDQVQSIGAVQEGEHEEVPEVQHPNEPWQVVMLVGGGRVIVAASDQTLNATLGLA